MANLRNLGEASRLIALVGAAGTVINGAAGGTVNGAPLGEFEYVTVFYAGTFCNNGTINVYACTNAAVSNPAIISTLNVGSSNSPWAAIDVKASAMGSISAALGTRYTHIGALGTVESSGTWRGGLYMLCTSPRTEVPGTTGLAAYGTYLV